MNNVVQAVSDSISLHEHEALVDVRSLLQVPDVDERLPPKCKAHLGECTTAAGVTYVWDPPSTEEKCRTYQVQRVTGQEVTVEQPDGIITIFSDDNQMIRLTKQEQQMKCGETVFATNFDALFLLDLSKNRKLPEFVVRGSWFVVLSYPTSKTYYLVD